MSFRILGAYVLTLVLVSFLILMPVALSPDPGPILMWTWNMKPMKGHTLSLLEGLSRDFRNADGWSCLERLGGWRGCDEGCERTVENSPLEQLPYWAFVSDVTDSLGDIVATSAEDPGIR